MNRTICIWTVVTAIALGASLSAPGRAQQKALSPTETVLTFYRALKERRYAEGFRLSIYRAAIEGLGPADLQDLEPEFARTFSNIPDAIQPKGEMIKHETATVFLLFGEADKPQKVDLIRVNGEWLVGDQESLRVVQQQGRNFFFNMRVSVREGEAQDVLARLVDAEAIYAVANQGRCATIQDLIKLGALPKELESGESGGYRFTFTMSPDQKSFAGLATPIEYGKTGRLSFYADRNGVRAEDLKGRPASPNSPPYRAQQ
jgi:hypothetical protein